VVNAVEATDSSPQPAPRSRRTGPRVMPGTYTIKMTKGEKVYTSKLQLVLDPRGHYNEQERRQQFDLGHQLYKMMARMSFAEDSMVNLRDTATARAANYRQMMPCGRTSGVVATG